VVQSHLHEGLCLDAANVQAHTAKMDVDANFELHEVKHICVEGDVRIQVVELEMK
jgi:hypothetical protein